MDEVVCKLETLDLQFVFPPENPQPRIVSIATSARPAGGRTSVNIRKVICPVVYVDFVAMYCTINTLMGMWRIHDRP